MVSLFKEKSTTSVFLLILLSAIVHISFFVSPPEVVVSRADGLMNYLLAPLASWPPMLLSFAYHVIVIVQALRLNYILQNNKMQLYGYLPAMAYIIFSALYPLWDNITPGLIINFFIIWLLQLVLRSGEAENKITRVFNIGFITGLSVLLYWPACMLIIVMLIGIFIFSTFSVRTFLIYLVSLLLPFYFAAAAFYLTDSVAAGLSYLPQTGWFLPHFSNSSELVITFTVLVVMTIVGLMSIPYATLTISARKGWTFLLLMLVLLPPGIALLKTHSLESLNIITIPAAAIASNFFMHSRSKVFSALLFWIMVLACWYGVWGKYILR